MEDHPKSNPPFWTPDPDDQQEQSSGSKNAAGDNVPSPQLEPTPRTRRDAVEYAVRHLGDRARAEDIVDGVARSAAKANRQKPIENPDSYLLSGVMRKVKRLLGREQRIEYVGSGEELKELKAAQDTDWVKDLENRLLVEELVGFMDEPTREIFFKRVRGDSWKEIDADLGITRGRARDRFRYGVEKARERVFKTKV